MMSPFEFIWAKHWERTNGIEHKNKKGQSPPKLEQGVLLMESEIRAKRALEYQHANKGR